MWNHFINLSEYSWRLIWFCLFYFYISHVLKCMQIFDIHVMRHDDYGCREWHRQVSLPWIVILLRSQRTKWRKNAKEEKEMGTTTAGTITFFLSRGKSIDVDLHSCTSTWFFSFLQQFSNRNCQRTENYITHSWISSFKRKKL